VYCSVDPSTAIMEVAVHKGFSVLDSLSHVLTQAHILAAGDVQVVTPGEVPNPSWLQRGPPSKGQQEFGRDLLERHFFVAIPSTASDESWNLVFNPNRAAGRYRLVSQKRFALDSRLNPP